VVKYHYPVEHAGYLAQVADVDSSVVQAVSQGHSVHRSRTKKKNPIEQIRIFAVHQSCGSKSSVHINSIVHIKLPLQDNNFSPGCALKNVILQMLFGK
jgi:hypothetical protein